MKIEAAQVVQGTLSSAGDGITGAQRCVLALADGSRRAAIVKFDPIEMVTAECFCSLLLRSWGLDVPDSYVVEVDGKVGFASADAGYPSLKQRLGISAALPEPALIAAIDLACAIAAEFKSTPLALVADEAIDNRDRNLGNILWDGEQETWIDHAYALGNGTHMEDVNQLAVLAHTAGAHDRVSKSALAQALAIDRSILQEVQDATILATGACGAAEFVADRLPSLSMKLLARFPAPNDLLSST